MFLKKVKIVLFKDYKVDNLSFSGDDAAIQYCNKIFDLNYLT